MAVDGESISDSETIILTQGDTAEIAVSLGGEDIMSDVNFTVCQPGVIRIEDGLITGLRVGLSAVILTFKDSNNITYTFTINVEVESLEGETSELVLLEYGASEYAIVVPHATYTTMKDYSGSGYSVTQSAFCNDPLRVAAEELRIWFKEATGVSLNVVSDSGLTHQKGQKYISLGNTALYLTSGAMLTSEEKGKISSDGSKIFSVDQTIYLIGGTDRGTCFAVYEWMNDLFDYDCFSRDSYYIDDSLAKESEIQNKNLKIKSINTLVLPSIEGRGNSISGVTVATASLAGGAYSNAATGVSLEEYAYVGAYNTRVYKYRIKVSDNIYFPIHTDTNNVNSRKTDAHNTLEYLASSDSEYENFQRDVSDFSSIDQNWIWKVTTNDSYYDICFSAHGNETSYQNMVAHFANKILFSLKTYTKEEYPSYNSVTISPEDGWNPKSCTCDTCRALTAKYGASYAGLKFVDDVAKKLDGLLVGENAQYRRDNFHVLYFAYAGLLKAPACTDACTSAEVTAFHTFTENLHEWVGVYYATGAFSYFNDIDSEVNASPKADALAWGNLIADKGGMTLWTYSTNYWGYLYYFDSVAFFETKAYQFFVNDCGAYNWRSQNQSGQYGVTSAFSGLQAYLDYKLMWNCNENSEELIVKWFKNKFGDAWDEMFAVFNEMRADFRETVMPGAIYQVDTAQNAVSSQTARSKGFIDYNIVGSADEITMGASAYTGTFKLDSNQLAFAYAKSAVYSIETAMDWLGMFDAVYAAFETQTSNAGLEESDLEYQILKKAIDAEWLSPAYTVLNRANSSLLSTATSTDGKKSVRLMDLKTQFKETLFRTRLVCFAESNRCFDYSTFEENELFFETLGYRGILTSVSTLLAMKAKVGDSGYMTWKEFTQRGTQVGEEITIAHNSSGTNFSIQSCSFALSSNGVLSELSKGDNLVRYKAVGSGTVTITMTYKVDGITHTTTNTLTVS